MLGGQGSSSLHFEQVVYDGNIWSNYHTVDLSPPAKLHNYRSSKIAHEEMRGLDPQTVHLLEVSE